MSERLLVCLDGEAHTRQALEWALRLARNMCMAITGLHVKDPYLKQFYNDIYAQGRREYLEHVDTCLVEIEQRVGMEFAAACAQHGVVGEYRVRSGEPLQEILTELGEHPCALIILGGKPLDWLGRFRSRNLPAALQRHPIPPVLVVRADSAL